MNKILIIIFLIGIVTFTNAQDIVEDKQEKSFTITKNQDLFVDFKFADNIKIEQWNKNEILVKVTYIIDDGEGNNDFNLKSLKNGNELKIYSDFGDYFKNRNKRHTYYKDNCNHSKTDIDYTLYIPKNKNVIIKSISGSVEINEFTGNLTTDLISGDVTIKKYKGELQLKTISGDLDAVITKARVKAKTLTGTIYSNLEIDLDKSHNNNTVHNKITGIINKGETLVSFNTISGNVYLRKL